MPQIPEFGRRQYRPDTPSAPSVPRGGGSGRGGSSGLMSTLKLAALGFLSAVVVVGGWTMLQGPERIKTLLAFVTTPELRSLLPFSGNSGSEISFSSDRLGRASTAPVLEICVRSLRFDNGAETEWEPAMVLQMLEAGNTQSAGLRALGKTKKNAELTNAGYWGALADCIYSQNATRLCDIDSRALAVRAANLFVREADIIAEGAQGAASHELQNLKSTRDRVLDGLRQRVRSGVLIAADFGSPPPAIREVLRSTETMQNDCAPK